jgi:hypothetical protein
MRREEKRREEKRRDKRREEKIREAEGEDIVLTSTSSRRSVHESSRAKAERRRNRKWIRSYSATD